MTDEEKSRELTRSSFAAQMAMLGYEPNGNPKDMVEVIRCKDCKWYKEGYDIDGKWFSRCDGSVRTYGHTKPDWFCADAERAT